MKKINLLLVLMLIPGLVFAKAQKGFKGSSRATVYDKIMPKAVKVKGATVMPGSFMVKEVKFEEVEVNGQTHLVAAVIFNGNIDASTVHENVNIRMLMQNDQGFWVDASTVNNTVNVRPNFITWVSGAPITGGIYKMHLRGNIKRADGEYLDCDGDGKGEGGNLPAYESQLYQSDRIQLIPIDGDDASDRLEDLFGGQ